MTKERQQQVQYLLVSYLQGRSTPQEETQLFQLLKQEPDDSGWELLLQELMAAETALPGYDRNEWQPVVEAILNRRVDTGTRKNVVRRVNITRLVAAASIIVLLGVATWFLFYNNKEKNAGVVQTTVNKDVPAPQTNRAMITLANGEKVYLDSAANGSLGMQGGVNVMKLADGRIEYLQSAPDNNELVYNTLSNPRGSKMIDMTLADGSRVWLNAGSTVTYPVAFIGAERKVSITGEAYFEVAHEAGKPFKVWKGDMEVTVLGTHFNVNAYDDEEAIKVTLLEGSVRVALRQAQGDKSVMITPGEQVQLTTDHKLNTITNINLEQVMAWKNGFFNFNGADVKTMMKQLERWYDIQVQYEGNIPTRTFGGELSRDLNLSEILQTFSEMKIKFRLEGRTLIVSGS